MALIKVAGTEADYYNTATKVTQRKNVDGTFSDISSDGSTHVHIKADDSHLDPYGATPSAIYSGTANGSGIISNITEYTDWTFQIVGSADAANTIEILTSLDGGTTYETMGLILVDANTYTNGAVAAAGVYKFGAATGVFLPPMAVNAIKVTRAGANTLTPQIDVYAIARPVS